ncbi:MAG: GspE/PulE family protein [Candidatus Omnitrophica bacterium]|nr:GspE/PulE family protein [Candidatus Omnitrophota bacterium]
MATKDYKSFKHLLIRKNLSTEEDLLLLFSKEFKMPFLDLKRYKISFKNKEYLPKEVAFRYNVLPICKIGNALTLATANPLDVITYDDIKILTSVGKVDLVLSREDDVAKALQTLYKSPEEVVSFLDDDISFELSKMDGEDSLENLVTESQRPPIVRAIDLVIYNALKKRASDIHIEPYEDGLMVKYRVDGALSEEFSFPKSNQAAVIARLKIISSLDITESRLPQDGRFKVTFQDREIDFRVSSLPIQYGEKFVLRVLDKKRLSVGLKNLGFSPKPLAVFEQASKHPFGIILVTGPTGSGKSTTLYSIINQINTPEKNIITIEDPIEYQIEGITQIQAKAEIGLTFASGLRSVLRQSPDIIMVGEIRDAETADIAVKASLTGEVILSTLHTNTAVGAITRLIDMGVEPFLLASSLVASTAQRLVRQLCSHCKEAYTIEEETLTKLSFSSKQRQFYRAKGCSQCNNTGYRGRIAILEILMLDDRIREMIVNHASEEEIIEYAKKAQDFTFLRDDGFLKCIDGETSLEEVLRVTTE